MSVNSSRDWFSKPTREPFATKNNNKRAAQSTVRQTKSGQTNKQPINTNIPRNIPLKLNKSQQTSYKPLGEQTMKAGSTPGGVRVVGREMVTVIEAGSTTLLFGAHNSTAAYATLLTPVNFPRLSGIAATFEFYKFHSAVACFRSNQPTTVSGVVEMAIDYDVKDAVPTTTGGMLRNFHSGMANVYSDLAIPIDGKLSRLPKFVYAQSASADNAQLYQANILLSFEGVVAVYPAVLGYLVVEYDCEFYTPQ